MALFRDWRPHPDDNRPPFPYTEGCTLKVRPHNPPTPPFGGPYPWGDWARFPTPIEVLADYTHSEACLRHPPLETTPPEHTRGRLLRIVGDMDTGDERGAQLVLVRPDDATVGSRPLVAKIYDPLYYSYFDEGWGGPKDVASHADGDYSREAAAYARLQESGVDGRFAPTFHGAWTFDMAFLDGQTRPVRMILLEQVRGITIKLLMDSGVMGFMDVRQPLQVLATAMETDVQLIHHGVAHRDFGPENILLVGDVLGRDRLRVVFVDFGNAGLVDPDSRSEPLPMNPLDRFPTDQVPPDFQRWVPVDSYAPPGAFLAWKRQLWGHSPRFLPPLGRPPRLYIDRSLPSNVTTSVPPSPRPVILPVPVTPVVTRRVAPARNRRV